MNAHYPYTGVSYRKILCALKHVPSFKVIKEVAQATLMLSPMLQLLFLCACVPEAFALSTSRFFLLLLRGRISLHFHIRVDK